MTPHEACRYAVSTQGTVGAVHDLVVSGGEVTHLWLSRARWPGDQDGQDGVVVFDLPQLVGVGAVRVLVADLDAAWHLKQRFDRQP